MPISDEARAYVEKRLSHLDKWAHKASRCDVELAYQELYHGPHYRAEFMYHEPGADTRRAEARGNTLHEAVDIAVAELTRQLSQGKKKRLQVLRRTAVKVKEYLRGWRDSI